MKTDDEIKTEELDFVLTNLDMLATKAAGNWMDRTVRPKKDRVKYTVEQYKEDIIENVEYWRKAPIRLYINWLSGIKDHVIFALADQYEHYNTVYHRLNARPDLENEEQDREKKAKMRALRATQQDMELFDAKRKCLACFKFMFMYDETNNKRHKKPEVCTCNSSRVLQSQMKAKITLYRKALKDKKRIPKKDPERYR